MRPLLFVLLAAGCAGKTDRIRPADLARELAANPADYVVVDVRSDKEWAGRKGHIPEATHLAYPGIKETADQIEVEDGQKVVLVCFTGHRSRWSMEAVRAATGAEVIDLKGGMIAWWRRDLPVEVEPGD